MYGHVPRHLYYAHNDIAFYIISTDGVVFDRRVEKKIKIQNVRWWRGWNRYRWKKGGGVFKNRARLVATRAFLGKRGDEILLPGDGGRRSRRPAVAAMPTTHESHARTTPTSGYTHLVHPVVSIKPILILLLLLLLLNHS